MPQVMNGVKDVHSASNKPAAMVLCPPGNRSKQPLTQNECSGNIILSTNELLM